MLPLHEELWRVFTLKQQTFWPGSLPYEEAIKTSAITIRRDELRSSLPCYDRSSSILKFTPVR